MKRSAYLIFNPVAGQGDAEADLVLIRSILELEFDLAIHLTSSDLGADQLALAALQQKPDLIIASGGDGTLSAAATALINGNIPLGIIPRGTANAFAAALDIPTTIEGACWAIVKGTTRVIDAAYCNGYPMVLLAGIGFEAETVERANRQAKSRFGMLAYIMAGLQQLGELAAFDVEIETEDRIIKTSAAAVTIANAAPPTSVLAQGPAGIAVDDGLLDMTIVAPVNRAGAIAATYHLFQTASSGDPATRDDVGYLRGQYFKITTEPKQKLVVDGEIIGTTPVEIHCLPASLQIVVPQVEEVAPVEKLDGLPNLVIEEKQSEKA